MKMVKWWWTNVLYKNGLGLNWLANIFAFFGIGVALLGIGTFGQVKSITDANKYYI